MKIFILTMFGSFVLAAFGVFLFIYSVKNKDIELSDQLSLKPLEEDLNQQEVQEKEKE